MKALAGKTVVVTRASEQASELSALLAAEGACVHQVPTINVVPVSGDEQAALDLALEDLAHGVYGGVLMTSANAVRFVHARLRELGLWDAAAKSLHFAIGPATAHALVGRGVASPIVADEAIGEGLVRKLTQALGLSLAGRRLLLPRARTAREEIVEQLRALGAQVDVVTVYDTLPLTAGPGLPQGPIDWFTFASPSAVKAFVGRFGPPPGRIGCIGPVTAQAAGGLGLAIAAVAKEHTSAGLVAAMREAEALRPSR